MRHALFSLALALSGLLTATVSASTITGFNNGAGFVANGAASASANSVQLTSGALAQAGSIFTSTRQDVSTFVVQFDYLASAGIGAADGATFTIQNSAGGASALGSSGGGLGYGGISSSVSFQINLYALSPGGRGTAINSNGLTGQSAGGNAYQPTGPVPLLGAFVHVTLAYDGANLTQTLISGVNSYTASDALDIAAIVGGTDAFIGFTGGTGFESASQSISNFTFETALRSAPDKADVAAVPFPPAIFAGAFLGAVATRLRRRV